MKETKNPVGAPSKGDNKRETLGTPFTVKRRHLVNKGKEWWRTEVRDFIKSKESEIEKA
jgi:hypothetical protein